MSTYKVLIITRSFPPDGIVATVRPSKMAKYLSLFGHDVTVIRSGKIFGKGDLNNLRGLENVHIFSYEGLNSDAEMLERGEEYGSIIMGKNTNNNDKKKWGKLRKLLHIFVDPIQSYIHDGMIVKKQIVELYNKNEHLRNFDIIISTFSPLGCIQAGRAISKKEKCKWIIDFRDLMDNTQFSPILRLLNRFLQNYYCKKCNACLCVSEGNSERLRKQSIKGEEKKVYTFYNGYDDDDTIANYSKESKVHDSKLHICYTGTIHNGKSDGRPLFKAIKDAGLSDKIVVDYAGGNGLEFISQAEQMGLKDLVINHGYLSRNETAKLQIGTDLFLVLSWNTRVDQGILTGKYYEAISHHKPIIAIVGGDIPNSELKRLIQEYHLGICYEEATGSESLVGLEEYLLNQYSYFLNCGKTFFQPNESVYNLFKYRETVKKLEKIFDTIVGQRE